MKTPLIILIIGTFVLTSLGPLPVRAVDVNLPAPGAIVKLSPAYNPPILKGIKVHPDNPFKFEFVLDKGSSSHSERSEESQKQDPSAPKAHQDDYLKLIKYFLAALTVPEQDLWVNLSPYEKDRIVPEAFGQTEMGRDLLAQDYILKQITASLIYPEDEVGKKFWKRVYEESAKKFGTTNIPVNTFNKVWIVPEKAIVYENAKNVTAYVVETKLKVMLEEDYLANAKSMKAGGPEEGSRWRAGNEHQRDTAGTGPAPAIGSQIIREIIIPQLYKEINEGQNFAQLRQVYNSLILATWYKKKLKNSILTQVYSDQNKIVGLSHSERSEESQKQDPSSLKSVPQDDGDVETIYQRYLHSFKKGAYNYIKEDQDPLTKQAVPRKYFSGGMDFAMASDPKRMGLGGIIQWLRDLPSVFKDKPTNNQMKIKVDLVPMLDYIQAQRRLTALKDDELAPVLVHAGIISELGQYRPEQKDQYLEAFYNTMAQKGYGQDDLNLIKGKTNTDPRLDTVITKQNGNPRAQSIMEAVANSIDAMGGKNGQFGKGVKQIIDWLNTPEDAIDVITLKDGQANRLHLALSASRQLMTQVQVIGLNDFYKLTGLSRDITHGTLVRIKQKNPIALDHDVDALHVIEDMVHQRFAIVQGVEIITQVNQEPPKKVNGWEKRRVIAGPNPDKNVSGQIMVKLNSQEISILDQGEGMDARVLSRMMIPAEGGTKIAETFAEDNIQQALSKVALIEEAGSGRPKVSFTRNLRTVMTLGLDAQIVNPKAVITGDLFIEMGPLIEVNQEWEKIVFSQDHDVHKPWPMEMGLLELARKVLESPTPSMDKLKYINSMVHGLEAAVGSNESNAYIARNIKAAIKKLLMPLLLQMQGQGYVFLPDQPAYDQLALAKTDKVIFLHDQLMDWQGYISLKQMGAVVVDKNVFHLKFTDHGVEREVRLISMPFAQDVLNGYSIQDIWDFDPAKAQHLPLIMTEDYIIVPAQWSFRSKKFIDLISKKGLSEEEKNNLAIQAQLISTAASQEIRTTYEIQEIAPSTFLDLQAINKKEPENMGIDVQAIKGFLSKPPFSLERKPAPSNDPMLDPRTGPLDRYVFHDGKIVDVLTGQEIKVDLQKIKETLKMQENFRVDGLEHVYGGYYTLWYSYDKDIGRPFTFRALIKIENGLVRIFNNVIDLDDSEKWNISENRDYLWKARNNVIGSSFDVFFIGDKSEHMFKQYSIGSGLIHSDHIKFSRQGGCVFFDQRDKIIGFDMENDITFEEIEKIPGARYRVDPNVPMIQVENNGKREMIDPFKNNRKLPGNLLSVSPGKSYVYNSGLFGELSSYLKKGGFPDSMNSVDKLFTKQFTLNSVLRINLETNGKIMAGSLSDPLDLMNLDFQTLDLDKINGSRIPNSIIDERDPDHPKFWDYVQDRLIPFKGEIIGYKNNVLYYVFQDQVFAYGDQEKVLGRVEAIERSFSGKRDIYSVIFDSKEGTYLLSRDMKILDLGKLTPGMRKTFDGRFYIIHTKFTQEVIYLDPLNGASFVYSLNKKSDPDSNVQQSQVPQDAKFKYAVQDSKIIDISTSKEIELSGDLKVALTGTSITDIKPLIGSYYYLMAKVEPGMGELSYLVQMVGNELRLDPHYKNFPEEHTQVSRNGKLIYSLVHGVVGYHLYTIRLKDDNYQPFEADVGKDMNIDLDRNEGYAFVQGEHAIHQWLLDINDNNKLMGSGEYHKKQGARYRVDPDYPVVQVTEEGGNQIVNLITGNAITGNLVRDKNGNSLVYHEGVLYRYSPPTADSVLNEQMKTQIGTRGEDDIYQTIFGVNKDFFDGKSFQPVDLQTYDPSKLFRHPKLNLLIDDRALDFNFMKVYSFTTGHLVMLPLGSKLIHVYVDEQEKKITYISKQSNGLIHVNTQHYDSLESKEEGLYRREDLMVQSFSKDHQPMLVGKSKESPQQYYLHLSKRSHTLNIDPSEYDKVVFDGVYFVFTSKSGDQFIYLNPDKPDDLIKVDLKPQQQTVIPPDARKLYYIDKDRFVREIGTGHTVLEDERETYQVPEDYDDLVALGDDTYLVTRNGGGSHGLDYIRIKDGWVTRLSRENVFMPPNRKYVVAIHPTREPFLHISKPGSKESHEVSLPGLKIPTERVIFFNSGDYMALVDEKSIFLIDLQSNELIDTLSSAGININNISASLIIDSIYYQRNGEWFVYLPDLGPSILKREHVMNDSISGYQQSRIHDLNRIIEEGGWFPDMIYKHPSLELIIDQSRQDKTIVYDLQLKVEIEMPKGQVLNQVMLKDSGQKRLIFSDGRNIHVAQFGSVFVRPARQEEFVVSTPSNRGIAEDIISTIKNGDDIIYRLYAGDKIINLDISRGTYKDVSYDGKYFVFVDPKTGRAVYVNPKNPPPSILSQEQIGRMNEFADNIKRALGRDSGIERQTDAQRTQQRWREVLVKKEVWVKQAQATYMPFWNHLPEALQADLEQEFKNFLTGLYGLQEKEIIKRFHAVQEDEQQALDFDKELPFDKQLVLLERLREVWARVKENSYVLQEIAKLPAVEQAPFIQRIVRGICTLVLNNTISDSEGVTPDLIEALSLGFEVNNNVQLNLVPSISQLVQAFQNTMGYELDIVGLSKIISFLSAVSANNEKAAIMGKQIRRILNLNSMARGPILWRWFSTFKEPALNDLVQASSSNEALNDLGPARDFVAFLTNQVDEMVPQGQIKMPENMTLLWKQGEGEAPVHLEQLAQFNNNKPRPEDDPEDLYPIEEIVKNIGQIAGLDNARLRNEIAQYVNQQREAGGYTAEVAQNSSDAHAASLKIKHFIDQDHQQYVEEMTDDGEGAPLHKALALLIPKSNKNDQEQRGDVAGFFGTGKYTIFAGVDEVQFITNNGTEGYMFVLKVDRDAKRVQVQSIGKLNDPQDAPKGVTVRRITSITHVLPELEQMLSFRAWKIFAGMATNDHFAIVFDRTDEKELRPLQVKGKTMLAETDFIVDMPRGQGRVNFGKMRLWSTKDADMPMQVVDKKGLRVDDLKMKEKFLELIPEPLKGYVKDFKLIIQVPLPLIQNRTSFEREAELMPQIQKYVAVELYKALVTKRLNEEDFYLNPIPRDFETSPSDQYDFALDPRSTPFLEIRKGLHLYELAKQVSDLKLGAQAIDDKDVQAIAEWFNGETQGDAGIKEQRQRAIISFLTQIEVDTPRGRNSLLMRRIKTQSQVRPEKAKALAQMTGVSFERAVASFDGHASFRLDFVRNIVGDQKVKVEIITPRNPQEKAYLETVQSIVALVGFKKENVVLVNAPGATFGAKFVRRAGQMQIQLNAESANISVLSGQGNVVQHHAEFAVHETAHFLEAVADYRSGGRGKDMTVTTRRGSQDYTHDGRFIRFMRLIAVMTLSSDQAMHVDSKINSILDSPMTKGGIDFQSDKMNILKVNSNADDIKFKVDQAMMKELENTVGFRPEIIELAPLDSLPQFLGVVDVSR